MEKESALESVLVFPPVTSHYRFLIHKFVEDIPELTSFSIGAEDRRRTVICSVLLRKDIGEETFPSEKRSRSSEGVLRGPKEQCINRWIETKKMNKDVGARQTSSPRRNRRTRGRGRGGKRPDQQLYVPVGRRGRQDVSQSNPSDEQTSGVDKSSATSSKINVDNVAEPAARFEERQEDAAPSNDKSKAINITSSSEASCLQMSDSSNFDPSSGTCTKVEKSTRTENPVSHSSLQESKHSTKAFDEMRTSNSSDTQGTLDTQLEMESGSSMESSDADSDFTRQASNSSLLHSCEIVNSKSQEQGILSRVSVDDVNVMREDGDPCGRMESLRPKEENMETADTDTELSPHSNVTSSNSIPSDMLQDASGDDRIENLDEDEGLKEEIGPKESVSHVDNDDKEDLISMNAKETECDTNRNDDDGAKDIEKQADEESASVSISHGIEEDEDDDDSWDKMFDDSGESLIPDEVQELSQQIKKTGITTKKPKNDYNNYNPKDNFDYSAYEHIIELYDFPSEFKTQDLITSFSAFKSKGFDIKWVDDTHALAVFATPMIAQDALSLSNPMLRSRHLSLATKQSKMKAKSCADSLQPHKPRPETSALVARNLVSGALGLKTKVSREQRDMERRRLKEVKEKRREDKRQTEDIWEGKI